MGIRVGTCAWADHQQFYPKTLHTSERLSYYARFFSVVEIDSSYYKIPSPRTVQQWVDSTPSDFVFDIKAYRTLTRHDRGEASPAALREDFQQFEEAVSVLRDAGKLGVILFQFPPWFVCHENHQSYVAAATERFTQDRVAIEFRHRSWWLPREAEKTAAWLRERRLVNVTCDEPQVGMGTVPFVDEVTDGRCAVLRLHGRNEDAWYQKGLETAADRFDYLYRTDELLALLPAVRRWENTVDEVHVLMNNNQGNYAITNALDWLDLLGIHHPPRPRFETTQQTSLFPLDGERG